MKAGVELNDLDDEEDNDGDEGGYHDGIGGRETEGKRFIRFNRLNEFPLVRALRGGGWAVQ